MNAHFDHLLVASPDVVDRELLVARYWRRADRLRQLADKPLMTRKGRAMMLQAACEFDELAQQVAAGPTDRTYLKGLAKHRVRPGR